MSSKKVLDDYDVHESESRAIKESEWRDIPGTDGWYQCTKMGHLRSWMTRHGGRRDTPKILQGTKHRGNGNQGEMRWRFHLPNGKLIATYAGRAMWETWRGAIPAGMVISHINGDKTDNRLYNLRCCDRATIGHICGPASARKAVVEIDKHGEVIAIYGSAVEAAKHHYCHAASIRNRCRQMELRRTSEFDLTGTTFRWEDEYYG